MNEKFLEEKIWEDTYVEEATHMEALGRDGDFIVQFVGRDGFFQGPLEKTVGQWIGQLGSDQTGVAIAWDDGNDGGALPVEDVRKARAEEATYMESRFHHFFNNNDRYHLEIRYVIIDLFRLFLMETIRKISELLAAWHN